MGMYDIVKGVTVYCSQCGKVIHNEFNTKDFPYPLLKIYNVGDKLPYNRDNEDYIEIHSICEHCELFSSVYINVKDNILENTFN